VGLWIRSGLLQPIAPHMQGVNTCPAGDSSNWGFVPAGVGTQSASCQLTGLQPSTTYSFVLGGCWASACASVYGNTLTFATLPAAASFDFTLSVSPSTVSVKQGDAANYQISITYSDPSYSGTTITVQVSGLGPGMNYQTIPTPPGLRVSTSQSTPTSIYTITLVGYANGVTHQTSAMLIVQQAMTATPLTGPCRIRVYRHLARKLVSR
jgi:hypothetical protein